jgi:heme-degrading monooxygenase HmoA
MKMKKKTISHCRTHVPALSLFPQINYLSCTVWKEFSNFEAWRKGDAFKEAHGGGTVGGVASMLLATAMNTKGKPVPAYWGGLLPVSSGPGAPPSDGEGWRSVVADGETMLDKEVFLAMNRFSVKEGSEGTFEQRFANRDSILTEFDGFKGFLLLRRDGGKRPRDGDVADDGYTHSTWSVWKDRASFEAWRASEKKPSKPDAADASSDASSSSSSSSSSAPPGPPAGRPNIFTKPPVASFYEGILTLESAVGV